MATLIFFNVLCISWFFLVLRILKILQIFSKNDENFLVYFYLPILQKMAALESQNVQRSPLLHGIGTLCTYASWDIRLCTYHRKKCIQKVFPSPIKKGKKGQTRPPREAFISATSKSFSQLIWAIVLMYHFWIMHPTTLLGALSKRDKKKKGQTRPREAKAFISCFSKGFSQLIYARRKNNSAAAERAMHSVALLLAVLHTQ